MVFTIALYATARRLRRACEGVAALEFALVFPAVLILVMGVIEVSMILFVSALMEGGLRDAARFGITGNIPTGKTREEAIIDIVNDRLMGFAHVTSGDVKMRVYKCLSEIGQPEPLTNDVNHNGKYDPGDSYTDINGNGQWDADMAASGAGGSGDVVVYQLSVNWHLLTPFLAPFFGEEVPLGASIAVRNEPGVINNGQGGTC
jgi:hypothetical protein